MNHKWIFTVSVFCGAQCILAGGLLSGCETLNQLTEMTTEFAASSGMITSNEAASINRSTRAVTKTFEDITPEQEYYIGRTVAATVLTAYEPYQKTKLNWYVNEVGQTLAQFSERPETFGGYHFLVLDSEDINAFAAPGGLIFVTRGLLRCCKNEDELASVLAHEIGHVTELHGLRAIRTGRLNSALIILAVESGKNLGGEDLAQVMDAFDDSINEISTTLMNSGYSRKLEYEADAAAVRTLRKAGYQPSALVAMLENMEKNWDSNRHDFAATHPPPSDRISQLKRKGLDSDQVAGNREREKRFREAMRSL